MTFSMILAGLLAAAACVGQQTSTSTAPKGSDRSEIAGQQADRSRQAAAMLRHVHQARQAIAQDNRNTALEHVRRAGEAFDRLDSTMTRSANNRIPIYQELERTSIIGPIEAAKRDSGQEPSDAASADRSADRATDAPAVQQMAGEYTVVSLDTSEVKPHLEAAEAALEQGNLRQADTVLTTIQSGVTLTSADSDLPLLRARRNLAMAHRMASEGRHQDAAAPLNEAAEALNSYAATLTGTRAAEASRMRDEMREFAQNMGQNQAGAASRISGWWNTMSGWSGTQAQ